MTERSQGWINLHNKCRVLICPGYDSFPCRKSFKQQSPRQKRCPTCILRHNAIRSTSWKRKRRKNDPKFRKREELQSRRWRRKNRVRLKYLRNKWSKKYYKELKDEVYNAYGGYECQCPRCDITEPLFLTLDHVENDGSIAIKKHGNERGRKMWIWIKKNNFPKGMFQVMWWNCNSGRGRNEGLCPHFKNKRRTKQ